jgi:NAD(P)-dependent dehydrogenase (short-subunit alcohol dehydrogenase family)
MKNEKMFSLANQVIVITGATGVLGESFSIAIAQAGAKVVIIGRNKEKAEERVKSIEDQGGQAFYILADVLDEESLLKAKEEIMNRWGTIDGLVNAAGGNVAGATIQPEQNLFEANIKDTQDAVDLNLFGTVIPTKVFGKVIAEKGKGSIVNISSLAAQRPLTRVLGYTLAKSAIEGYTKWMSVELALRYGDQVRMNAIAPGVFLTEQNRSLLTQEDGSYSERAQKIVNHTPFGRLGKPEELMGTLVFLLSDASGFINGETIIVDGGFNAYSGV